MSHEVVDWEGIDRKTWIRFTDKRFNELCMEADMDPSTTGIGGMAVLKKFTTVLDLDIMLDNMGVGRSMTITLNREDYECSLIDSPDFRNRELNWEEPSEVWSQCERNYGITHLGSKDPCPLRQLAFAILRGDGIALDAARDILRS